MNDRDWFDAIPKVELHLHLEGSIPHDALWRLIEKYGGDAQAPDQQALADRFRYRDFAHFIDTWIWKNRFLRQYADFALIAEHVARDLARQNVRYAEVFFSPGDFARSKLAVGGITEAIREGLDKVAEIRIALIVDLVRDLGPERGKQILNEVLAVPNCGVIGVGIGGSEQAYPPEPFADVYAQARTHGLHVTAHAGEAAGASSIWGAIRSLQVERIGHGVRAQEDPVLLEHLAAQQIPLEMCPTSNVCTGVVTSMKEHPIRLYDQQGILVTVNTDDPTMFGTTLAQEYGALVDELGFTRGDVRRLTLNAITASWLPDDDKRHLHEQFQSDPIWQAGVL